jgi:NADPH-dependent 2,4-dienoyl-CoA reductase/sulfur reductase-like enzyme
MADMDRRRFLACTAATTTAAVLAAPAAGLRGRKASAAPASPDRRSDPRDEGRRHVAVLGGGCGGLSAARELVERGFTVDVYERYPVAGGECRSIGVPGTGAGGRADLPGEHGFRF